MKSYLLNTLNRYKQFSEQLDVGTMLCNNAWCVFNDSGEREIYIFQEDGSLIISVNGNVSNATWKYISVNKSLIINTKMQSVMLQPAFIDKIIFSLRLDGTNNFAFLIDEANKNSTQFKSLSDIEKHIENRIKLNELEQEKESILIEERRKQIVSLNERNARLEEDKKKIERSERLKEDELLKILKKDKIYIDFTNNAYNLWERYEKFEKYFYLSMPFVAVSFLLGYFFRESKSGMFFVWIFSFATLLMIFFGAVMNISENMAGRANLKADKRKERIRDKLKQDK